MAVDFVPGSPHVTRIIKSRPLNSYQHYHMFPHHRRRYRAGRTVAEDAVSLKSVRARQKGANMKRYKRSAFVRHRGSELRPSPHPGGTMSPVQSVLLTRRRAQLLTQTQQEGRGCSSWLPMSQSVYVRVLLCFAWKGFRTRVRARTQLWVRTVGAS